jgi:hypothetical protein
MTEKKTKTKDNSDATTPGSQGKGCFLNPTLGVYGSFPSPAYYLQGNGRKGGGHDSRGQARTH